MSVLLGHGDGTFLPAVAYAQGAIPKSLVLGDFNDDGRLDLAVADSAGGLEISLGHGDGTFLSPVTYAVGNTLNAIAAGDLDADGQIDLVVTNRDGNVYAFLGNGDGTFEPAIASLVGVGPTFAQLGDVNADGNLDLVVANGNGSLAVLLGNGDGTFATPTTYPAGADPRRFVLGDFDGDGRLDIGISLRSGNAFGVLLGNGDGTFQTRVTASVGFAPSSLTAADFNADQKLDPVMLDAVHGNAAVLLSQGTSFNHRQTGFALTGVHNSLSCAQCHVGNFSLTSPACLNCHTSDFNGTTNPPHKAANYPTGCAFCHSTANWTNAEFNHAATGFALTGFHTSLQCVQCHSDGAFDLTSGACINCHAADFANTTNPPHAAANYPQGCASCHTTSNWTSATFNHTATGFALTGFHTSLQCVLCHSDGAFDLTSGACINCHSVDFANTTNPPHAAAGYPQDCTLCHSTTNWTSATFSHTATGFALTGAHTSLSCAQCHLGNFSLTSPACLNCHTSDFNGTTNPPHKAANYPTDCAFCHTTASWAGATFDHAATGFALTGLHSALQCVQCHTGNTFNLTSGACLNCHASDFNATTNPPHEAASFPTGCAFCHTTSNWTGAVFNHAATGFGLTGLHASLQCVQCHAGNNYSLTSGACINCHAADFDGTTNPPHMASGYPQDCTLCHTTATWQ